MTKKQKALTVFYVWCLCWAVFAGCKVIDRLNAYFFSRDCGSHIKMAADANSIELAKEQLGIAVKYLDDNNIVSGNSALVFADATSDVGLWHRNLTESLGELEKFPPDASHLERSNQLIKLRETLLDHGKTGVVVTQPDWIYLYPSQYIQWISLSSIIVFVLSSGYLTLNKDNL